jgi:hypothetical protein
MIVMSFASVDSEGDVPCVVTSLLLIVLVLLTRISTSRELRLSGGSVKQLEYVGLPLALHL